MITTVPAIKKGLFNSSSAENKKRIENHKAAAQHHQEAAKNHLGEAKHHALIAKQ